MKHTLCFGKQQKYYTSATRASKKAHPLKFVIFLNISSPLMFNLCENDSNKCLMHISKYVQSNLYVCGIFFIFFAIGVMLH